MTCHGDFHKANIVISQQGPLMCIDLERTHVNYAITDIADFAQGMPMDEGRAFIRGYLERASRYSPCDSDDQAVEDLLLDAKVWAHYRKMFDKLREQGKTLQGAASTNRLSDRKGAGLATKGQPWGPLEASARQEYMLYAPGAPSIVPVARPASPTSKSPRQPFERPFEQLLVWFARRDHEEKRAEYRERILDFGVGKAAMHFIREWAPSVDQYGWPSGAPSQTSAGRRSVRRLHDEGYEEVAETWTDIIKKEKDLAGISVEKLAALDEALNAPRNSVTRHTLNDGSLWITVGGSETGGIYPYIDDTTRTPFKVRLAWGTIIEEVEQSNGRVNYRRLRGDGPEWGWADADGLEKLATC